MTTTTDIETQQDSKNTAAILWVATVFLGFLPGLVLYLIKKDDAYVQSHAKESLNWCITAALGYVAGVILTFVLIGVLVFMAVGLAHLIFCIMGALAASKGKPFRAPFALRLLN